ncbi:MAG TPA: sulfotransferase [Candidatus Limnocylindria bacterium]
MTTPRWPEFYIVGAPKAGTTSLYAYLADHPQVFLPERKELRYFGSDLAHRRRRELGQAEFLEHYAAAPAGRLWGNAYVWYLFSRVAAREIRAVRPDARIVVMLRDPVRALHALHSEFVFDGNEDIEDFGAALAAEPERRAGRRIPAEAHFPEGLCYLRTVAYREQLERYLDVFGREQVHVALLDDFMADAEAAARQVLDFLGLPPAAGHSFPHRNPNKRSRSAAVRRLLAAPPPRLRAAIRRLVPAGPRRSLYRRAADLNVRPAERSPLPEELERELRRELDPEVAALEALLGRSLAAWRAGA